jgi:23S rRNA (cytidine1920-2'-O)/16S rRNA (cytidine1409-2'-O)-methyltransferase
VRVDGVVVRKAARPVTDEDTLVIDEAAVTAGLEAGWVSRGASKLLGALADLSGGGPTIEGVRCADVGASTGGFTQVLLDRGAAEVLAIDVGHGQLASALVADPRVVDLPGRNVRELTAAQVGGAVDVLVADLSFISLTAVMGALASLVRPGGDLLLLVKPQFEVGRRGLDGRGVVRDESRRRQAVEAVLRAAVEEGLAVRGLVPSRTLGQDGNVEYIAWLHHPARRDVGQAWQAVIDMIDELFRTGRPWAARSPGGSLAVAGAPGEEP